VPLGEFARLMPFRLRADEGFFAMMACYSLYQIRHNRKQKTSLE